MNSYPPELLAQLAPVMFVAGLDAPPTATPPPPSVSPTLQTPAKPQDAFTTLTFRLRDALLAQRKVAIWQPDKSKSFQILLVDRDVRFPPRKLVSPDDPQFSAAHSPLSPLTPSSPLYPDGLIAPIWIRKHTTLVPSVFVLFLRIFEYPPHSPRSPLDAPDTDREREREQEERRRDTELSAEVAHRKKSTNERGIKLTVVLMASRKMLDDPSLDGRLTFIRRQSGLDSRAALFVLSPVSPAELGDFVKSLQQALFEPALEYYTTHSKRVRRKRNRHSSATTSYPTPATPLGSAIIARPLRPEGWTVRYEYKMACFAEFRGEDEVALKHYQDAYGMLVIMFGSTAILPPRTKRWAEAKVLADSINIKVSKLYLYNNEHALALSHHSTHMRKFSDFSRGWGIGEETFEYWSWLARQNRIFAELLEQGTRSTLTIPVHKPIPPTLANPTISITSIQAPSQRVLATSTLETDAMRSLGINPSHALQHPGFYYYMAARSTELRRQRFLDAVEAELNQQSVVLSPGFANEKKVDHLVIILELYTKAYELFKKYTSVGAQSPSQGRLTLWIAYRIAQTYYDSGKFDMAVRFFERIAKTYRREGWGLMLRPLLSTWYACAQQLGDVDLSVKLLVEMLGHEISEEDPSTLEDDLLAVLKSTVPSSSDEPLVVDLSESNPIFNSNVIFWAPEVTVNEMAAFQLTLTAPTNLSIAALPSTSMAIYFSDSDLPMVIRHVVSEKDPSSSVRRIDVGHVSILDEDSTHDIEASLRWRPGDSLIISGTMSSEFPTTLKISKLILTLTEGPWNIEIPFDPCYVRQESLPTAKWLSSLEPVRFIPVKRDEYSSVLVRYRPHKILVSLKHQSPAYLDEEYPIIIDVTNVDERELDVVVDVLLQPTEIDDADNAIILDGERSSSFIKGVPFGVLAPGVSVVKTLYLVNTGAGGDRMIDVSIQSRSTATRDETEFDDSEQAQQDMTETLRTLTVSTVKPIEITHDVVYRRSLHDWPGLADLSTFESDSWDNRRGGEAHVSIRMECVGPWSLEVANIRLEREETENAKIIDSSTDGAEDMFPAEYFPGDEFASMCRVSLSPVEGQSLGAEGIQSPGKYVIDWRRIQQNGDRGPTCSSTFLLPSLHPPVDELIALLSVPPIATLHTPISLVLTIRNHHLSRSANITVQLELDALDGFVVAGLRSGRVPILMPGTEEKLTWRLIPIECGYVKLPLIKVVNRRKTSANAATGSSNTDEEDGEMVRIIDVRFDQRKARDGVNAVPNEERNGAGTILVLP